MKSLINVPLERTVAAWWGSIDDACRKAFLAVICVNVIAFGFEMTNLTLHHDDVAQIYIQDTILGHYLGRFGVGWLHYYTQNHYFMPFLQLLEGIVMMSAYGVLVAYFWGARKATDIALMAAIVCVFPYMAHVYQYNTAMATYPAAHLLAALAVVLSARAKILPMTIASLLFVAALSIYQGVAANAATIFVIWLLSRQLFGGDDQGLSSAKPVAATISVLVSVVIGGAVYLAAVSMMQLQPDTIHSTDDAFHLRGALNPWHAMPGAIQATRAFLLWPESYFPDYLKALQLVFLGVAAVLCLLQPKGLWAKCIAVALLLLAIFAPRVLQVLHPEGHFHTLTLTAYALVIAGAVMIVNRAGQTVIRNASIVLSTFLIVGYVIQCNWISTVNYLNTLAHFTTMTQVLAKIRSLPGTHWDGKKIAVVGSYAMSSDYPFKPATGVATKFLDAKHMDFLARLMRDEASFVAADLTMPKVMEYAANHPPWPDPASVGVVDGMGVVVLSKPPAAPQ